MTTHKRRINVWLAATMIIIGGGAGIALPIAIESGNISSSTNITRPPILVRCVS